MNEIANDLSGRVAVVMGGASGIGRAIARTLAECKASVLSGDYDPVDSFVKKDADLGIESMPCDVRNESQVQALIQSAIDRHGRLDILVNSAGIGLVKPITEVAEAEWDNVMDTNLKGAFLACKHALQHMTRERKGVIVNIASNAGILPRAHDPVYSISKHALVALTKSLALAHGHQGVRVNAICPGPVCATRMMDNDLDAAPDREMAVAALLEASPMAKALGRMVDPHEVAQAALYLVSDAAQMVTGTLVAIDGAKSLGVPPTSPT